MSGDCVIYCRISKDRTGARVGVDRQERECRELADRVGLPVREVYTDNDMSAYSGKPRPGYQAMLAAIQANPATVIVWHTDRLHRSPRELESYIDIVHPAGIETLTVRAGIIDLATPSGRMFARQMGVHARFESEHMAERIQADKAEQRAAGKWSGGGRPFGFEPDGVTIRQDEADVIRSAAATLLAGGSLRAIVRDLNSRGVRPVRAGVWSTRSLRMVLRRARNAGLIEHDGRVVGHAEWGTWTDDSQSMWGAILTEQQWQALVTMFSDPARRTGPAVWERRWLGSGLYLCGVCGAPLRGYKSSIGTAYRCSDQTAAQRGQHVARKAEHLDAYVEAIVLAWLRRYGPVLPPPPDNLAGTARAAQAEAGQLRERLNSLAVMHADGLIDDLQLAAGSGRIRERLAVVEAQARTGAGPDPLAVFREGEDPAAAWELLDVTRRQAVIRSILTVTVLPAPGGKPPGWEPGRSYFRPEYVRIELADPALTLVDPGGSG